MDDFSRRKNVGFLVIGAMKLASAVLLYAAGFGLFRLLNKDLGAALEHLVFRLHLDSENRLIREAIDRVGGVDHAHRLAIIAGTFVYAILHTIEGTGLMLRKHWAEYLTVVVTGGLLPLEFYELAKKLSWVRILVLSVNLRIMAYVIVKLVQERRSAARAQVGEEVA